MSNLTLYTTTAIVLLDLSDASRIIAKYYQPPHAAAAGALGGLPPQLVATNPFATVKEQRAFEKAIWEKTRRNNGESPRRAKCVVSAWMPGGRAAGREALTWAGFYWRGRLAEHRFDVAASSKHP